jgi:hypothetical protein
MPLGRVPTRDPSGTATQHLAGDITMTAYTNPTPARKSNRPSNYYDWMEAETRRSNREDQERPAAAASLKTVARYARLDTVIEGYAVRTPDRRVFFLDGTTVTELTNADIPRLTLLGDVTLVEEQQQSDRMRGDVAHIASTRRQEV